MKKPGLGAGLKPLTTTSTACSVNTFAELRPMLLASTLSSYSPYSSEPLKHLGLDPQKVTKLAVKLHAHSVQHACEFVGTR